MDKVSIKASDDRHASCGIRVNDPTADLILCLSSDVVLSRRLVQPATLTPSRLARFYIAKGLEFMDLSIRFE
jgi:hypothetical protein